MKRILVLAVIAVFVMMPLASFAKTAISDSDLAAVTAQDGVVIDLSHFTIDSIQVSASGWGDVGGYTGATGDGWVGAQITTTAGSSGHFIGLTGNLTIDVGSNASVTSVKIGLPGINIDGSLTQKVVLATTAGGLIGSTQVLGTSVMTGITLTTSGYVVISSH
jgi:hypothetical protein